MKTVNRQNPCHLSFANLLKIVCLTILPITSAKALEFSLPSSSNSVVGEIKTVTARPGDTLARIGQRYDIGYVEMAEANPGLDPDRSISPNTAVKIPSQFVLPDAPRHGVVINLAELRLYYYPAGQGTVITMPVGIGREGWETPLGASHISAKVKDPTWRPTKAVRDDAASQGYHLPTSIPPGPDNPLGEYAMRLGGTTYLIHSTNKPEGVGRRSSAGCMRMFPEDAEALFHAVPVKTPVYIVNQPYKVGWQNNKLVLEAHMPLQEQQLNDGSDFAPMVQSILRIAKQRSYHLDWETVEKAAEGTTGVPVVIGTSYSGRMAEENNDDMISTDSAQISDERGSPISNLESDWEAQVAKQGRLVRAADMPLTTTPETA